MFLLAEPSLSLGNRAEGGVRNGKPDFLLRNQCCRRGCTSRRNPPMSSKGFSTRAARDLIDKLVEHDEPIKVFCAHDGDDIDWDDWLQTHRVELNAMTTPELINWLDDKMQTYGDGKLIPPEDVLV